MMGTKLNIRLLKVLVALVAIGSAFKAEASVFQSITAGQQDSKQIASHQSALSYGLPLDVASIYESFENSCEIPVSILIPACIRRSACDSSFSRPERSTCHGSDLLNSYMQAAMSSFGCNSADEGRRHKRSLIKDFISSLKAMKKLKGSKPLKGQKAILLEISAELHTLSPIIADALTTFGDEFTATEVAILARWVPKFLKNNFDFVASLKDFSEITLEILKTASGPEISFSLHQFPAALKTLSWDCLMWVLDCVEFDLSAMEFELLIDSRGAAELLKKSSPFFTDIRAVWLIATCPLQYFKGTGMTPEYTLGPGKNYIHPYLGNLLSSNRLISTIRAWERNKTSGFNLRQLRYILGSHLIAMENYLAEFFNVFGKINNMEESLSFDCIVDDLKLFLDERIKLTSILPPELQFELTKIPLNSVFRESLVIALYGRGQSKLVWKAEFDEKFDILTRIWGAFIERHGRDVLESVYPRDILLKYAHPNEHQVLAEWCKYYTENEEVKITRFTSGHLAAQLTSHIGEVFDYVADESFNNSWELISVMRKFVLSNNLYEINYGFSCNRFKVPREAFIMRIFNDFNKVVEISEAAQKAFIDNAEWSVPLYMRMRYIDQYWNSRLRFMPSDTLEALFEYIFDQTDPAALPVSTRQNGPMFSVGLIKHLISNPKSLSWLKREFCILHGLSFYSAFTAEELKEMDLRFDLVSRGLHTIPFSVVLEWAKQRDGLLDLPAGLVESVNNRIWMTDDLEEIQRTSSLIPLTIVQSSFTIAMHNHDKFFQKFFKFVNDFPDHLLRLYQNGASWAEVILVTIRWLVCWEMNFRQFFAIFFEKNTDERHLNLCQGLMGSFINMFVCELSLKARIAQSLLTILEKGKETLSPEAQEMIKCVAYCMNSMPLGTPERIQFISKLQTDDELMVKYFSVESFGEFIVAMNKLTGSSLNSRMKSKQEIGDYVNGLIANSNECWNYLTDLLMLFEDSSKFVWEMRLVALRLIEDPFTGIMNVSRKISTEKVVRALEGGELPFSDSLLLGRSLQKLDAAYWNQGAAAHKLRHVVQDASKQDVKQMTMADIESRILRKLDRQHNKLNSKVI